MRTGSSGLWRGGELRWRDHFSSPYGHGNRDGGRGRGWKAEMCVSSENLYIRRSIADCLSESIQERPPTRATVLCQAAKSLSLCTISPP